MTSTCDATKSATPATLAYQQHQSQTGNNISYASYQRGVNPPLSQQGATGTFQNALHHQPSSATTRSNVSSTPATTNPSTQQIEDAWKEYTTPSGLKYYHNDLLKESTYNKPEALLKKERANTQCM